MQPCYNLGVLKLPKKEKLVSIILPEEFVYDLSSYSGNATKCFIFFRRLQIERQGVILKKFILACSYETIRLATGIKSNVAIKSALAELQEKGWIESIKKGSIKKGLQEKESNTYILANPDGQEGQVCKAQPIADATLQDIPLADAPKMEKSEKHIVRKELKKLKRNIKSEQKEK